VLKILNVMKIMSTKFCCRSTIKQELNFTVISICNQNSKISIAG